MKLLITFISCDTTVPDTQLLERLAVHGVQHEIINATTPPYSACGSIKDIEAEFEAMHNYTTSDDLIALPECKVKVLKIEPISTEL
jgi:hypothetical protein